MHRLNTSASKRIGVPAPFVILCTLLALLVPIAAGAQSTNAGVLADSTMPPIVELASFERVNGNLIVFGGGATSDDLAYFEVGAAGTSLAFSVERTTTLLDRYLALASPSAPVPRALVTEDPLGTTKIGSRTIVESVGRQHLDLPITGGGNAASWGCGADDTQANFEAQFCNQAFGGSDLVIFCDSQRWWDNIRQENRRRIQTFTAYCGGSIGGIGAVIRHSEWRNTGAGWEWVVESSLPLTHDQWLYVEWLTGSSSWKQGRHTVTQFGGGWLGTLRAATVFSN
ncbi:MAG: hypothetical protein AAGC60_14025 [Acidobacteriota bacterium]